MEKKIKQIRYFLLVFAIVFFGIGLGIELYLEPKPENFTLPYIFMGIGLFDILIVSIWSISIKIKNNKEKKLLEYGQRINAKLFSIELNTHFSVNNRNPYYIVCQWTDTLTGENHTFHSKNIWFNPSQFVDKTKSIQVIYDPNNIKNYVVDLSFLPQVS